MNKWKYKWIKDQENYDPYIQISVNYIRTRFNHKLHWSGSVFSLILSVILLILIQKTLKLDSQTPYMLIFYTLIIKMNEYLSPFHIHIVQ